VTNGGRVLTVTAQGNTISEAVDTSIKALTQIQFQGMNFRKDIGYEFKG
jgi:phosphoribosylamine--glycine ligase